MGVQGSTSSPVDELEGIAPGATEKEADVEAEAAEVVRSAPSPVRRKPKFVSLNAAEVANREKPSERVPYSDEEDEDHQVGGSGNCVEVVALLVFVCARAADPLLCKR